MDDFQHWMEREFTLGEAHALLPGHSVVMDLKSVAIKDGAITFPTVYRMQMTAEQAKRLAKHLMALAYPDSRCTCGADVGLDHLHDGDCAAKAVGGEG